MKSATGRECDGEILVSNRLRARPSTVISRDAVIKCSNRRLLMEEEDVIVRVSRGQRARLELGDYYLLDVRTNTIVGRHIDLKTTGRDLGVLKPHEKVGAF